MVMVMAMAIVMVVRMMTMVTMTMTSTAVMIRRRISQSFRMYGEPENKPSQTTQGQKLPQIQGIPAPKRRTNDVGIGSSVPLQLGADLLSSHISNQIQVFAY